MLKTGHTPVVLRGMEVVFLPNVKKSESAEPKAHRPIMLFSFLLKVLERIVQWYLLERVILPTLTYQHVYTRELSCKMALSTKVMDILVERSVHHAQMCLDCSRAFDKIRFDSANLTMEQMQGSSA